MIEYTSPICPNIQKKLEEAKVAARHCEVTWAGGQIFEVSCMSKTYIVDLDRLTCLCRKWDLSGIPCSHVVSLIMCAKKNPEEYVHPYYNKDKYLRSYRPIIIPIPDQSMWV